EHMGRYAELAETLVHGEFAVYGNDHRGHHPYIFSRAATIQSDKVGRSACARRALSQRGYYVNRSGFLSGRSARNASRTESPRGFHKSARLDFRHPGEGFPMSYDPAFWSRLQFGFTLTYHYLFPQLTMGLAWFLVYWKWRALRTENEKYNQAVRFWAKIFGLNFAVGVVTGIPMEFQFGTNWADFSRYAGGVIGQTLAMEGMFAFFLESAFVGALIWGEKRLGPRYHFLAAVAVALGSWLSAYFILVTNAFMQHPVGYRIEADGLLGIVSLSAYLLNPWAWVQFTHNQMAALVTGSFVVTAVG